MPEEAMPEEAMPEEAMPEESMTTDVRREYLINTISNVHVVDRYPRVAVEAYPEMFNLIL